MSLPPWPDHLLSLDEWNALPEDNTHRYELVDGVLHVVPRGTPLHQRAVYKLADAFEDQLPSELAALIDGEILLSAGPPPLIRVPDVLVARTSVAKRNPPRFQPGDVALAVEVMSPGSRTTDRGAKLCEYGWAGIPNYWIIDIDDPVSLTAYHLVDGEYELIAENTGTITLSVPAPVTLHLDSLVTWPA